MTSPKILKQAGQATLEILLVGVISVLIWTGISKGLKASGSYQKIFGTPWLRLVNMIEFGVPSDKGNLAEIHPANPGRHSTRKAN